MRITTLFLSFLFLILFAVTVSAQQFTPLELVVKVFTDDDFVPEIPKYITGQYDGTPNVSTINQAYQLSFKLLEETPETAIVNVTLDSMRQGKDIYIHLRKEEVWKIQKIKSLPINYIQQEGWQQQKEAKARRDSISIADDTYPSDAEAERNFAHAKMWFALDDQIIDHFKAHEAEFAVLLRKVQKEGSQQVNSSNLGDYKNLSITLVLNTNYCGGCYDFLMDDFIYSSLGYLYIPNAQDVPKMGVSSEFIVIKAMGNGWYFYKKN